MSSSPARFAPEPLPDADDGLTQFPVDENTLPCPQEVARVRHALSLRREAAAVGEQP